MVPGAAAASGAPSTTTATDSTAVFPMLVNNTGKYNDTYTLSGTAPVKNTERHHHHRQRPVCGRLGRGPAERRGRQYLRHALGGRGQQPDRLRRRGCPRHRQSHHRQQPRQQQPESGLDPERHGQLQHHRPDRPQRPIQIGAIGSITAVKTQSANGAPYSGGAQSAKPGQTLNYRIIVTNKYNGPVAGVQLKEKPSNTAFTFTNFVSATTTASSGFVGKQEVYYSTDNGATFTTTAPAAGTNLSVAGLIVAVDTNATTGIDAGDLMPENATITLDLNTTVK